MPKQKRHWYAVVPAENLPKIVPPGWKLAVLRVPFSRTLCLTWWLDASGRVGRKLTK